jgi:hypothetical protein
MKRRLYYISNEYLIQNNNDGLPTLIKRNGGGSPQKVKQILKMVGMEIISKVGDNLFILGASDG